jgi:hypothetical protein
MTSYWDINFNLQETISSILIEELKDKAKLGYRVKNLKAIATTLTQGFPEWRSWKK